MGIAPIATMALAPLPILLKSVNVTNQPIVHTTFQAASQYYVDAAYCHRRSYSVVSLSVCLSVTIVSPATRAQQ